MVAKASRKYNIPYNTVYLWKNRYEKVLANLKCQHGESYNPNLHPVTAEMICGVRESTQPEPSVAEVKLKYALRSFS